MLMNTKNEDRIEEFGGVGSERLYDGAVMEKKVFLLQIAWAAMKMCGFNLSKQMCLVQFTLEWLYYTLILCYVLVEHWEQCG